MKPTLTDELGSRFSEDGFVVLDLLDRTQAQRLRTLVEGPSADPALREKGIRRKEGGQSGNVLIAEWNYAGPDVFSRLACSDRLISIMEHLLGGSVYVWEFKLTGKDPVTGGVWRWHQDFGYWHYNGLLMPQLASAWFAIDPATKDNGCLELLKGSHHIGRLDTVHVGDANTQRETHPQKLEQARERFELVTAELNAGQVLILHCNVLHRSGPNRSPRPRWSFIPCYNRVDNPPCTDDCRHALPNEITLVSHDEVFAGVLPGFAADTEFIRTE